jgi:hypothetical protein
MEGLVDTLSDITHFLNGVQAWVLKNKEGLTREDAKRIFQRYRAGGEKEAEKASTAAEGHSAAQSLERQSHQIGQIVNYMEQTTKRLDQIEDDIGYIKDKVDAILKRL